MMPEGDPSTRAADLDRVSGYIEDERYEHDPRYDDDVEPRQPTRPRRTGRPADRRPSGPVYRGESDYRDEPVYRDEPAAAHRIEEYLGDEAHTWDDASHGQPPVVEYTDVVDEEAVWGPRPKLMTTENGGRRTVVITGRGSDGYAPSRTSGHESALDHARHFSADRTAMWAVLLCVIVLLVAVTSH